MPPIFKQVPAANGSPRLAINLFDLDRIEPTIRELMLGGKLILEPIRIDPHHPDETAMAFSCDLLTAACMCDTIRHRDRQAGDFPSRVYVFRKSWSKLPANAVLARVLGERVVLDPVLFPTEIEVALPLMPHAVRRVF